MRDRPLIGIPCCVRSFDDRSYHMVGEKYLIGLMQGTGGLPILIPALIPICGDAEKTREKREFDLPLMVAKLDGLFLTGSPSNIDPAYYEPKGVAYEGSLADRQRDATTLPLIAEALRQSVPIFAVCRGMQELNVALGGSLHQKLWEVPERNDHRMPQEGSEDERYAPRHTIACAPEGMLAGIAKKLGLDPKEIPVNSLHGQGIDRIGDGLFIEAVAMDGTCEAVRVVAAPGLGLDSVNSFALGVQWHPEYKVLETPFYAALFQAFQAAIKMRQCKK